MYLNFSAGLTTGDTIETTSMSVFDVYVLGTRYFSPVIGQFISADTFNGINEVPSSLNKYAFVHNDPINFADPSGHAEIGVSGELVGVGIGTLLANIAIRGLVGGVVGGLIGGASNAYLHVLTTQSFDGVGSAFLQGAEWGAVWGAVIGASSVNPTALAITLSGSLGYSLGQTLIALTSANLPARTKIAIVAMLLLQGTLSRGGIQRGITASEPNFQLNVGIRNQYVGETQAIGNLRTALQNSGQNTEAIARAAVDLRNSLKVQARGLMDQSAVGDLEARNTAKYGNPIGPTADQLYSKYGSWDEVINASMRTNPTFNSKYGPAGYTIPFPPLEDDVFH